VKQKIHTIVFTITTEWCRLKLNRWDKKIIFSLIRPIKLLWISINIWIFSPKCIRLELNCRKRKIDIIKCHFNYKINLIKSNPNVMTFELLFKNLNERLPKKQLIADLNNQLSNKKFNNGKNANQKLLNNFKIWDCKF